MEFLREHLRSVLPPDEADAAAVLLLDGDVRAPLLAAWPGAARGATLVLTHTVSAADQLAADLAAALALLGVQRPVHVLPELENAKQQLNPEQESERCRVLHLAVEEPAIYVASILAALAPTPAPASFVDNRLTLEVGMTDWPPEKLASFLTQLDYDNEPEVHVPGEFSWRGGILDLYSPAADYPVRLDFFGAELESIRLFDPETQRSIRPAPSCRIIPRGEAVLTEGAGAHCFLDYLPAAALSLVLCDTALIDAQTASFGAAPDRAWWRRLQALAGPRLFLEPRERQADYPAALVLEPRLYGLEPEALGLAPELADGFESLQRRFLKSQVARWLADDYRFVLCCESQARLEKALALLTQDLAVPAERVTARQNPLAAGFYMPEARVALLTEAELFGRAPARPRRRKSWQFHSDHLLEHGATELAEGDLAVHAAYGVCRYLGLRFQEFHDQVQEVLVLEFADDVKVFVPLDQAHLVARYVGASKAYPKLSKVGGKTWQKARSAASDAVNDLAAELLRLHAIREATPGYAFDVEDDAMAAFAEAFPYTETPDQHQAIEETLADMRRAEPMDRLVCGDVGFGKTEVAMRAAFQAVLAGKQVAVLVPTTILCQQHYLNFCDRFREYPVLIENLSRFRTGGEQHRVIQDLAVGKVDIVIGTHRILSPDVAYKDLGLVIIDEEQRFGVQHKERLKQLRVNVDILTMTATPIPRTLYQSLAGLRDLSTIVTPPQERLPVQTIVTTFDKDLVRAAILREIERGGQLYYLHNRVATIGKTAETLRTLVPEATFDIGHGQMHEHELEDAMLRFIEGRTHVLVCTTIIESGLDIPNANTIIIDRADRFGLAELYQLRGRVGRYHRQAYAYLLIPPHGLMIAQARERLAAIRKYTQLGAGFKLAMRDLEIRGAGNILGAEQSGHITAVGFDLYCELLKEAVARLKGAAYQRRQDLHLHLPFLVFGQTDSPDLLAAYIPTAYVADQDVRVDLYRRLSAFTRAADLNPFAEELADRFGPPPEPVLQLLEAARLKIHATSHRIHSITVRDGDKLLFEGPRGHLKLPTGKFPRLHPRLAPADQLQLVIRTLKSLT